MQGCMVQVDGKHIVSPEVFADLLINEYQVTEHNDQNYYKEFGDSVFYGYLNTFKVI